MARPEPARPDAGPAALDPRTGLPWMAEFVAEFGLTPPPPEEVDAFAARDAELSPFNTTIAVVATDALLSPAACRRVAVAAQDGLAHTIRPVHTPLDGDVVFAAATGRLPLPDPLFTLARLGTLAAVTLDVCSTSHSAGPRRRIVLSERRRHTTATDRRQ